MERWQALFGEYRAQEAERLELERRAHNVEALRRELEDWSRRAIEWLLAALSEGAERRADELALATGVRIEAKPPRRSHARHPRAEVTFIELVRERDVVYIYAYHELGSLPLVHYLMPAYEGFLERAKYPRLISLPGCRLLREKDDRVVLDRIDIDGSTQPIAKLDVDDLLFRGFELLLRGRSASRAAGVRLPEAALVAIEAKESAARA